MAIPSHYILFPHNAIVSAIHTNDETAPCNSTKFETADNVGYTQS